jgi:hypothetical protein
MRTRYDDALLRRVQAAVAYAERIQASRPDDHAAIAQAWAHVRRLKAASKGATR